MPNLKLKSPYVGPAGQVSAQFILTFADEFNGSALNTNAWDDSWSDARGLPNTAVEDGRLKIWPAPGADFSRHYKHLTTKGAFYQTYGYFEAEAKLPIGKGTWPAFWLYNNEFGPNWKPEMDIMEAYSGQVADGRSSAELHPIAYDAVIWKGAPGDRAGFKRLKTPDLSAGFHTYGLKWEPDKQTYYFDGKAFFSIDVRMSDPEFIILSFQFDGTSDGTTPTGKTNAYEVNYVRAWQLV